MVSGEFSAVTGDATAARLIAFLRAEGAEDLGHAGARPLLDHLVGTYDVVRRWGQPPEIAHAALIHSVYGTDVYAPSLLPLTRRHELISLVGEQTERLAYLFSVTPRNPLLAGTLAWLRDVPSRAGGGVSGATDPPASRCECDALIVLHMGNLAEQAQARDGSPGVWLARLRELAELVIASDDVTVPAFIAELATFTGADEARTRELYRAGLTESDDLATRCNRLAAAAAACAVVAEPCIWLAHISHCRQDAAGAIWWARAAQRRLRKLGTTWDKRLTFGEWSRLARRLEQPGENAALSASSTITEPRVLFAARCQTPDGPASASASAVADGGSHPVTAPAGPAGRERFHRYIDTLVAGAGDDVRGIYPGLEARPWHDASDFPLAAYLEAHFEEIRGEILALEPAHFHRESERIERAGDWDVAFFYERGRRRQEVCEACPVTTHGIETLPAMLTAAGLSYVSRMRPGTHIRPHRGPTNLRLRCHLGVTVPDGDCALRVDDVTRSWQEGRCLVFDDYFEHEAWNHTDRDRIVLIVDLWHPGLSAAEIRLLEGLHGYAYGYAQRLQRYWAANATTSAGRP